jgi:hypothetical protein
MCPSWNDENSAVPSRAGNADVGVVALGIVSTVCEGVDGCIRTTEWDLGICRRHKDDTRNPRIVFVIVSRRFTDLGLSFLFSSVPHYSKVPVGNGRDP